ncbi:MAG: NfeD family protein, partial [Gemmatimonadetes bacterium]|nr:NfeD family protein [Gemmatimonadota bacterium]
QLWIIAGVGLLIAEMIAPGFWLINVAVGCFASALAALIPGVGLAFQTAVFAAGTLVSAVLFRPILLRHFHRTTVRTNVDALIGKTAVVTQRIEGATLAGRVLVDGEDWRGAAIDDTTLEPGTRVTVIEVDGSTLKVEREMLL